jgi:predicted Zn-dependent protease
MTAHIAGRGRGRANWHSTFWRFILAAVALALVWLLLSSAAAAQERRPASPRPPVVGLNVPLDFADFRPDKFVEQLFRKAGADLEDNELLAKVAISWSEESQLGQDVFNDLRRRLAAHRIALDQRGKNLEYLKRLVALLQPQMKQAQRYRALQVFVADVDLPNAYALPAGRLIVTRGMLEPAGCEAALVCVLGHELSHLDRGHLLRRMKQWRLAQDRLAQPPTDFSFDRLSDQMSYMSQLFLRPFGPDEELEADRDGITWAYQAGYDPLAVEQVYAAMDEAGITAPSFLPAFLRSHPLTAQRRQNLRATVIQLQTAEPKPDLYPGRENLRRRTTWAQQTFVE